MMKKIKIPLLILAMFFSGLSVSHASSCNSIDCDGYGIPSDVKAIISQGYEKISITNYGDVKYLTATTSNDTNKCSVLFEIKGGVINSIPSVGLKENICNVSTHDDKIVSSWRDAGQWNDDVYHVNSSGDWILLFRDSCVGCSQVKRTFFFNGKENDTVLLSDGNDFTERTPLKGQVSVGRATLFNDANINMKTKAYLIKGDAIELLDMSKDGGFYKIKYKSATGKELVYWINSEDFSLY
ncbi:hypothetical protein [Ewingella americana]